MRDEETRPCNRQYNRALGLCPVLQAESNIHRPIIRPKLSPSPRQSIKPVLSLSNSQPGLLEKRFNHPNHKQTFFHKTVTKDKMVPVKAPNNYMTKMEKLIALVCPHPYLYDTDHENYKNVKMKEDIWNEIGSELNATGSWAKKEWRKLRDCHRDALKRRVGRNDLDGSSIKKWKFEDQMDFLLPYMKSRGMVADYTDFQTEQIDLESDFTTMARDLAPLEMCDAQIPSPSSCSSGTQKAINANQAYEKTDSGMDYFEQSIKLNEAKVRRMKGEKYQMTTDPLDSFFDSMCATTKSLPKRYQLKIKRALFDCVLQAEEEVYTKQSNHSDEDTVNNINDNEKNTYLQ